MASVVGRPQKGKTWAMLYAALHGWHSAGEASMALAKAGQPALNPKIGSRLIVSMEMSNLQIQQRLAAYVARVEPSKIKKASLTTIGYDNLKKGLSRIRKYNCPLYVVDGNMTATVEDIWALARQLDVEGYPDRRRLPDQAPDRARSLPPRRRERRADQEGAVPARPDHRLLAVRQDRHEEEEGREG